MNSRIRKNRRAFTLVELLVVVLILAILMAVALPLYLGAIRNSERGAARANMQTIANANQSHKLQTGTFATTYGALFSANSDLGPTQLKGPGDREYNLLPDTATCDPDADGPLQSTDIPDGSFAVTSTVTTDGCFIPGISTK